MGATEHAKELFYNFKIGHGMALLNCLFMYRPSRGRYRKLRKQDFGGNSQVNLHCKY
jgi:hypothetical protein